MLSKQRFANVLPTVRKQAGNNLQRENFLEYSKLGLRSEVKYHCSRISKCNLFATEGACWRVPLEAIIDLVVTSSEF